MKNRVVRIDLLKLNTVNNKDVSDEMRKAGNEMAEEMAVISYFKSRDSSFKMKEYIKVNSHFSDMDLLEAYANEEIDSVTAIFVAMSRKNL